MTFQFHKYIPIRVCGIISVIQFDKIMSNIRVKIITIFFMICVCVNVLIDVLTASHLY